MRRAGKATHLRQPLGERRAELPPERAVYLSFDDDRLAGLELARLGFLLEEYYRRHPSLRGRERVHWFFDEIQDVPGWERFVRRVPDSEKVALGNPDFAFTLTGAAGPALGLVLSASVLNLPCGACTLVPAIDFLIAAPSPLPLAIPCGTSILGATLYAQWIVLAPGGCPLAPILSLSGAVSVVIGIESPGPARSPRRASRPARKPRLSFVLDSTWTKVKARRYPCVPGRFPERPLRLGASFSPFR